MPSTVIANMKYDPGSRSLEVKFISGMVYVYADVPPKVFASMKAATSKGTYLNKYIKGHYEYRKVS